jgi:hypothetical protein
VDSPGQPQRTLRGWNGRIGSSGNVWQNWGYLARLWQAQEDRWRQQQGSCGSERNILAPQETRRNELSNGESSRRGILQLVNHTGDFGNAFVSDGRLARGIALPSGSLSLTFKLRPHCLLVSEHDAFGDRNQQQSKRVEGPARGARRAAKNATTGSAACTI